METSESSQLESSLNDSLTDGEENQSGAGPSPAASTQVLIDGDPSAVTASVQGVIQAPQTSVIQSPQVQSVQIAAAAEPEDDDPEDDEPEDDEPAPDTQKRRDVLSRRPSYRKIFNELSSDTSTVPKIEEETAEDVVPDPSSPSAPLPDSIYQTSSGQYIALAQGRAVPLTGPVEVLQGAQALTVTSSPTPQPGATILQTGESPPQFYIQGGQVLIQAATGDIPAYQLRSPNSGLAQSIVMAASPSSMQNPTSQHAEEITRKREVRLMKNREAARECRRKKKEYVKCLENRVAVLENQNKTLIEELKALKDIYCHKPE